MSCKPLKIEELRKQFPCQERFRDIRNRCLIPSEELKKLIELGKVQVVETEGNVQLVYIEERNESKAHQTIAESSR